MWVREIYRQMEGKEVYNTSGTWLHSLTGELHFRHHAVYHLEERTYGERNQLERTSAKLNKTKLS